MDEQTLSHKILFEALAAQVKSAGRELACASEQQRYEALILAAQALRLYKKDILYANQGDLQKTHVQDAFKERMTLNEERLEAMALGLEALSLLPDPIGKILAEWERPNGLKIKRVSVPLGVIGMIYESRPNVGADAVGIAIKSGNGLILRSGSEIYETALVIHKAMKEGIAKAGLSPNIVAMPPNHDREYVTLMLQATKWIDVIIPRGGYSLIDHVQKLSKIPILAHASGLCHTYIHEKADFDLARKVLMNAKLRRVGICGATETLLIDKKISFLLLPRLIQDLKSKGCIFVGNEDAHKIVPEIVQVNEDEFYHEWLDRKLSVVVVDDIAQAIAHINHYGSGHTEAIITEDHQAVRYFMAEVQSAVIMHNTSTQFCDGGEFGFGAEMGIATGRLHARGPVGIEQLTSYHYEVYGQGQVRP